MDDMLRFVKIYVHGNFTINQPLTNWWPRVNFNGKPNTVQQIRVPNVFRFSTLQKDGKSSLELHSNIFVNNWITIFNGSLKTFDHDITVNLSSFIIGNYIKENEVIADLGTSTITIRGVHSRSNGPLIIFSSAKIFGENSTLILPNINTGISNNADSIRLGTVESTNILGNLTIEALSHPLYIKQLILRGDGNIVNEIGNNIGGQLFVDSLIMSPGKSYTFQSGITQMVNKYWQARGNNCNPISIQSSSSSDNAIISMPSSARINMDFVQMRNMTGLGSAQFNAGPYSTNINNSNQNWTFPDANEITEEIGFLGPDQYLCPGQTALTIDANSYTPSETYRWSTGATNASIEVANSGKYHVTVTFGATCILTDTIEVFLSDDISNFLPRDTIVCDLPELQISSAITTENLRYLWSTGVALPEAIVSASGLYTLTIQNDNCSFVDSINISFIRLDTINLGEQISICEGDTLSLSARGDFDTWRWENGASTPDIRVANAGQYWVEARKGPCSVADTVQILVTLRPIFDLGRDTAICEGNALLLDVGSPDLVMDLLIL